MLPSGATYVKLQQNHVQKTLIFFKNVNPFFDNIKTRSWPSKHWLQHRHPQTISHRFTHLCWTHTHLASRCLQMQRSFFYVDLFLQSSIHFLLIQNMIHYHQNYSCDKESFLNIHILIRLLLTLSLNHSSVKGLLKWQCLRHSNTVILQYCKYLK